MAIRPKLRQTGNTTVAFLAFDWDLTYHPLALRRHAQVKSRYLDGITLPKGARTGPKLSRAAK
eukprot:4006795-Pyramimonas_sp.AAC.1